MPAPRQRSKADFGHARSEAPTVRLPTAKARSKVPKRLPELRLVCAIAALGALVVSAVATAGSTPRAGGVVQYFETSTRNGSATVVVTGPFTDYGVDHAGALQSGTVNQIVLKNGSFGLDIVRLDHAVVFAVDSRTCAYSESGSGPTRILDGTGAYAGIKGTLTITVSGRGILPRSSTGVCEKGGDAAPLVAVSTASGSGVVSF